MKFSSTLFSLLSFSLLTVSFLGGCSDPSETQIKDQFVTIGTGGITGVYYPAGSALCRIINKDYKKHGMRCNVESTGGSVYNVNSLAIGELSLAIAQADVTYKASHGQPPFKNKIDTLRALFALHPESVTLVARQDAKINTLDDVRGKRINIGNPGSGNIRTASELLKACNITAKDLAMEGHMKAVEMPDALRDKKLDAYFYVVGHPTANIKDVATSIPINLVNLNQPCIEKLVAKNSFFVKTTIPGQLYQGVASTTQTYGVKATLVTTSELPEKTGYQIVKAIFEDLDTFTALHPAFRSLSKENMLEGVTVPIHPGALRYYREQGWKEPK